MLFLETPGTEGSRQLRGRHRVEMTCLGLPRQLPHVAHLLNHHETVVTRDIGLHHPIRIVVTIETGRRRVCLSSEHPISAITAQRRHMGRLEGALQPHLGANTIDLAAAMVALTWQYS